MTKTLDSNLAQRLDVDENKDQWSLLVDGSALYFGQRAFTQTTSMNYHSLNHLLQHLMGNKPPKPAFFFTTTHPANEKQTKFNELINELGWTVQSTMPYNANESNNILTPPDKRSDASTVRFSTAIAYCLGSLRYNSTNKRILIATDSWGVSMPVLDCIHRGISITLAYFGNLIDSRWHREFRNAINDNLPLNFLDLGLYSKDIFDQFTGKESKRPLSDIALDDLDALE